MRVRCAGESLASYRRRSTVWSAVYRSTTFASSLVDRVVIESRRGTDARCVACCASTGVTARQPQTHTTSRNEAFIGNRRDAEGSKNVMREQCDLSHGMRRGQGAY